MEAETLAQALGSKELRELFTKTALLLAYTDGTCADGEKAAIAKYAKALEISDADLADLHVQVKEFLLAQLSHLTNVEAGAKVAGELEL
jgi:tellurite resistance protein